MLDHVTPQFPGHLPHWRHPQLGQRPIPFRPRRIWPVGQVKALDHAAALPASVRGYWRSVKRITTRRNVAHPATAHRNRVDIERHSLAAQVNVGVSSSEISLATRRYSPAASSSSGLWSSRAGIGLFSHTGM